MIIAVDLIIQSFTELTFGSTLDKYNQTMTIILFIIQIFLVLLTMIWLSILLWNTILFQFGMINKLIGEFKWSIIVIIINTVFFGIERSTKFSASLSKGVNQYIYLVNEDSY